MYTPIARRTAIGNRAIITEVPSETHHQLVVMAHELDVNRADLYAMLLIYCVEHSKVTVEEMVKAVNESKVSS